MGDIAIHLADWGPRLFEAAILTLVLTAVGFSGAFVLGLALEAMRTSRHAALRHVVGCYIWVLRAVPLLIVLYLLYFVLPDLGITLSPFVAGTIGLVLVHGAYMAEIFRAGMQAIEQGQWEAARALGLTRLLCLRLVAIPQAIRHMFGPLIVAAISVLKDSSVSALIGVNELTLTSRAIMSETFMPLHVFLLAGLFYLALGWPASMLARAVERRMNVRSAVRHTTRFRASKAQACLASLAR